MAIIGSATSIASWVSAADRLQDSLHRRPDEVEHEGREDAEDDRQRDQRRQRQHLDAVHVREVVAEALQEVGGSPKTTRWNIHSR